MPRIKQSERPPIQPSRARRSDALRNTERLLAAAQELFEVSGPDVAIDDIARRAGVGNATLYRNFPSRADLLVAVYSNEVAALCEQGEALLAAASPARGLFDWLDSFVHHVSDKRALAMAATQHREEIRTELFASWHRSVSATASRLLKRAQDAGGVRSDITAIDLLALANAIALTSNSTDQARRLLRVLHSGLEK